MIRVTFAWQNIETRVFSPTTYTVGEQRPRVSDQSSSRNASAGRKRKSTEPTGASQSGPLQGPAGGKNQRSSKRNGNGVN